MSQTLQFLSESILSLMRGSMFMLFVVMCVSLYWKRKENSTLNHLFWMLIIMIISLSFNMGLMINGLRSSYIYEEFKILTDLCLVPLVGSYLLKVIIPEVVNLRRVIYLFIPNILLVAIHAYTRSNIIFIISVIYTVLLAVLIFVFVVFIAGRYNHYIKKVFSNIDNKTVDWVRVMTYVFAAWYLAWFIVYQINNRWVDSLYYLFIIIMWGFIYHYSVKHIAVVKAAELFEKRPVQMEEVNPTEVNEKYLSEPAVDILGEKLQNYIDEHDPWLDSSLTLQELAAALGTNRTYLSDYLNNSLHTTFYDYINSFRVHHACKLLKSEPESQLVYVCDQSGFNSLSTFRRAFEKHIGTTPAKYRNRELD